MESLAINKCILLGVCGGIAAYKAVEIVRLLRKQGCDVRVVMTMAAKQFVTPLTFQAISGHGVRSELFDPAQEQAMGHIELARWADAILIAPASADMLAKLANGHADDLLSTLVLAAECPLWLAPAMNQAMWHKSVTQQNIRRLQESGARLLGPASGEQACGELGFGRMSEPNEICDALFADSDDFLQGIKIMITAGPTREALDPVRFISNRSSGKMGYALADAASRAGADVTLISGPVNLAPPADCQLMRVETASQMYDAVMNNLGQHQIFIGAAAVADFRPAHVQTAKIKKQQAGDTILLTRNPDIITKVAASSENHFVVGFAAETDDLENYARGKLRDKKLDMIAANWVGREQGGFESDSNALQVYWPDGQRQLAMTDKSTLAKQLLKLIAERMHEKNSTKTT